MSHEIATLAGGCFWCIETVFIRLRGVESAVYGYMGGHTRDPTYEDICTGETRHAEVVQVRFDPFQMINLAQHLERDGLPMIEYPQTVGNLTAMGQNLFDLIKGGNLIAYADDDLRRQISHAVAVESSRGWKISKATAEPRTVPLCSASPRM